MEVDDPYQEVFMKVLLKITVFFLVIMLQVQSFSQNISIQLNMEGNFEKKYPRVKFDKKKSKAIVPQFVSLQIEKNADESYQVSFMKILNNQDMCDVEFVGRKINSVQILGTVLGADDQECSLTVAFTGKNQAGLIVEGESCQEVLPCAGQLNESQIVRKNL